MLLNKKSVKKLCHDNGKRISSEAIELLDAKLRVLVNKSIGASGGKKTIKAVDVSHFQIKLQI